MAKAKQVEEHAATETPVDIAGVLQEKPFTIKGHTLTLVFTIGDLLLAKTLLVRQGNTTNIIKALGTAEYDVDALGVLLYAAAHTLQPQLTLEEVNSWVNIGNMEDIYLAVFRAYQASKAKARDEEGNE